MQQYQNNNLNNVNITEPKRQQYTNNNLNNVNITEPKRQQYPNSNLNNSSITEPNRQQYPNNNKRSSKSKIQRILNMKRENNIDFPPEKGSTVSDEEFISFLNSIHPKLSMV